MPGIRPAFDTSSTVSLALASLNLACQDHVTAFPQRTTIAFDDSSSRWLEINT
jgi:hypothetical protein